MRKLLLAILLFSFSVNAFSGEIKGAGAATCGEWLEARKDNTVSELVLKSWILGFISSYNHYVYSGSNPDGIFGSTDVNGLPAWMDKYCRENPLNSVYDGTVPLIDELRHRAGD